MHTLAPTLSTRLAQSRHSVQSAKRLADTKLVPYKITNCISLRPGNSGLSTADSVSLTGNAGPVSRMQGFPMMSCARVPFLSMCDPREAAASEPAVLSTWVRGALCSPFLIDMQIGRQVLLMSDQTVYFLINKHNMIQRCQELFNVHPHPGLYGVSSPAYPPPSTPLAELSTGWGPQRQFCPLSFPVPA